MLRGLAAKTGKTPKALQRKPELFADLLIVWRGYNILAGQQGSLQPVPIADTLLLFDRGFFAGHELDEVLLYVNALDSELIPIQQQRLELEQKRKRHGSG